MSMAEPKRRQKWSLNPRGTLWANDDTKFGQKLMEKMGWSKGRGLGREEQGITEHLSVKLKDDSKGIGYKGSDDEWIKHYEGFENVLASLNSQENINFNSKSDSNNDIAGLPDHNNIGKTSLESSSKASRVRVHYHKFTRSKDLSRCTKDDLGCILGSKRAKQLAKEKTVEDDVDCVDEVGCVDDSMGVTTVKGCSMQDYFAQKLEALRNRTKSLPQTLAEENHCAAEEEDVGRPGFGLGWGGGGNIPDSLEDGAESREEKKKRRKKSKKHQEETEEINSAETESKKCCVEAGDFPKKKKKKKRPESSDFKATNGSACDESAMEASNEDNTQTKPVVDDKPERKMIKKKHLKAVTEEHFTVKKKKKRKHTDATNEDNTQHLMIEENPQKKKKKKKCKAKA